jgi:hypothetical protein
MPLSKYEHDNAYKVHLRRSESVECAYLAGNLHIHSKRGFLNRAEGISYMVSFDSASFGFLS